MAGWLDCRCRIHWDKFAVTIDNPVQPRYHLGVGAEYPARRKTLAKQILIGDLKVEFETYSGDAKNKVRQEVPTIAFCWDIKSIIVGYSPASTSTFREFHGHVLLVDRPNLRAHASAVDFLRNHADEITRISAAYETVWDGNNNVARFGNESETRIFLQNQAEQWTFDVNEWRRYQCGK